MAHAWKGKEAAVVEPAPPQMRQGGQLKRIEREVLVVDLLRKLAVEKRNAAVRVHGWSGSVAARHLLRAA